MRPISLEVWQKYQNWRIAWAVVMAVIGLERLSLGLRMNTTAFVGGILAIAMALVVLPQWGRRVAPSAMFMFVSIHKIIGGYLQRVEEQNHLGCFYFNEMYVIGPLLIAVGTILGVIEFMAWRKELAANR